jgi:hypothetical protein
MKIIHRAQRDLRKGGADALLERKERAHVKGILKSPV